MSEKKIYQVAVTGSNGQLGKELARIADQHPDFLFVFLSRQEFPLDDHSKMEEWLEQNQVDFFIHTAAYTSVDKAESEKEKALLVNATASGLIASQLSKKGSKLIYISTDYVFDGTSSIPLTEEAPANPINWYGSTKLEGERLVLLNNKNSLVIRTSWVFSAYGNNFVKTMLRLMKAGPAVRVVNDQIGSPTYAGDLAEAILFILESQHFTAGILHYCNEGQASWYTFAKEIRELSGSDCDVLPISTSGFPTPAKRPAFSLMNNSRIKKVYGLKIPEWKTSLALCMKKINQGA
jgi:dTDP-4-dehydrorhamnose reductase